jgi:LysM repeat protein
MFRNLDLRKMIIVMVLFALVSGLMLPTLVDAQAGTVGFINTGNLNLRQGPSIAYAAIVAVPFNTQVTLLGRAKGNTWVQVALPDGRQGWLNYIYLRTFTRLDSLPITWSQPVPPTNPNPNVPLGPRYYTVRKGDNLKDIAARFGVTWQAIAQANNIVNPNLIYAGQSLLIPTGLPTNPPPVQPPATTPRTHIVKSGETLKTIAALYGKTWQELAQANGLANPDRIFAGQRLIIPTAPRFYTVRPGDTLYLISVRYGVSAQAIMTANNILNPNVIYVGQTLRIP